MTWKTIKACQFSGVFIDCSSLLTLPDISKWDTDNVTDMSYMFSSCSSLKSLPGISKWNMKSIKNIIVGFTVYNQYFILNNFF